MGIRWTRQPNGLCCYVETFQDWIYMNLPFTEAEAYATELFDWDEFVKTVNYWYEFDFEGVYKALNDKGPLRCQTDNGDLIIESWNEELQCYI